VTKSETGPRRLDEFKTIQESAISQTVSYLKNTWVKNLIDIIKKKFSDIGKGWFNMKETNRLTYEFGKLKRFLTVVRLNMQDCLKELLRASLTEFVESFRSALPETVTVVSQNKVDNGFGQAEPMPPLLSLDLVQVVNKEEFNYLFRPDRIVADILELFEKVVEELKKIPDLEPKILESLHKAKKTETFVITPILPKEKPEVFDPTLVPRRYSDENKWLWDLYQEFAAILGRATSPLEDFRQAFKSYEAVLALKVEDVAGRVNTEDGGNEMETFKAELRRWRGEEQRLKEAIAEDVQVSCFSVNCKETLRILLGKYQEICKKQIEELVKVLKESSKSIQKKFADVEREVQRQPATIEEMIELKGFIANELPKQIEGLRAETAEWVAVVELLESQRVKLPKDDLAKRWKLLAGPRDLMTIVREREKNWDKLSSRFSEQMVTEQEEFTEEVSRIESTVAGFHGNNQLADYQEMGELVVKMNEKLEEMNATARLFNKREGLLEKQALTDYNKIPRLLKSFNPYLVFWKTVSYWMQNQPRWLRDEWDTVDADAAEKFVEEELKGYIAVLKTFRDRTKGEEGDKFKKLLETGESVLAEIEGFKEKVPILVSLKKPGMRDRHWEELVTRTRLSIKIEPGVTFDSLLELGLGEHAAVCIEVGEKASREFGIEKALGQMYKEWEGIDFGLAKFKETGSFVINNFEFVESFLDQHLTDTQTLLINPFKKPFAEDIDKWYESLLTVSNVIEEWRRFQGQWCYLQPIFDSPDINKQLPNESALFKRVDGNWRQTLSQTKVQKNVLKVCTTEGYLDKFKDANASLDKIQKELRTYLELKRSKFGRFYFLSNDDLLSILSETKDVEKVQDHLRKVFENIARLTFTPEKKIVAMSSVENETVSFNKRTVDPSMRQVEDWMSDVEDAMMHAVREHFFQAVEAYPKQPRNEWILWPPGQCVLNGSQVHWTSETETAISGGTLTFYLQKLEDQLKDLVTIDRAKLSPNQFVTLEALIVIDVHAKDVIERLHKADITSPFDFEWVSQLRYYWEANDVRVKCLQTNYKYGYEYLGNTPRLVITPLTDKCYMTLMSAIKLNLGGAPAGPQGPARPSPPRTWPRPSPSSAWSSTARRVWTTSSWGSSSRVWPAPAPGAASTSSTASTWRSCPSSPSSCRSSSAPSPRRPRR
jgi:dynein heavy chain